VKNKNLQATSSGVHRHPRPFIVTVLIVVVLFFTSLNAFRFVTAIRSWDFLTTLLPVSTLFYLLITGFVWGILGIILAVGLFARRKWSSPFARIAGVSYAIYYWLDRLFIAEKSSVVYRMQFALGLTLALLIYILLVFRASATKRYLAK
jgi:hypothetical protein